MSKIYRVYMQIGHKEHFQLDPVSKIVIVSDDCDQEEASDILMDAVWELIQEYVSYKWEEVK